MVDGLRACCDDNIVVHVCSHVKVSSLDATAWLHHFVMITWHNMAPCRFDGERHDHGPAIRVVPSSFRE